MKSVYFAVVVVLVTSFVSCKKKGCTDPEAINYNAEAKKEDNSCIYGKEEPYMIPSTYGFTDANGNSTVYFQGQTDRLDQLSEMVTLMKTGTTTALSAQDLKDMFANTNGDGNGNFSFSSTKQLKDKCFALDQAMFEGWMDSIAQASLSNGVSAANGQAGVLSSGTSTYLFDKKGKEYVQFIEKGLMGAVFFYQALNVYFSSSKMDVDNSVPVDPAAGSYYTAMEHHWDEAFGYFGVPLNFPTAEATRFWGKYCSLQDPALNCNADMMDNFLKGRAAISASYYSDRDAAIQAIRREWEDISAYQAITYINGAIANFGTDEAKFLHELSEAYAFAWNLRYAPETTRRMTQLEHSELMGMFKDNFWDMTISDLTAIKTAIEAKF